MRVLVMFSIALAMLVISISQVAMAEAQDLVAAPSLPVAVVNNDELNVRAAPSSKAPIVGKLWRGQEVVIYGWAAGEMLVGKNGTWARVGPGQYVYTTYLYRPRPGAPPPPPANAPRSGRWIDLNLTQQVITAYEGGTPVYWALTSTGMPGWETPVGVFRIQRRVANETMDSRTLAVPSDFYRLENVLYTQYFTNWGHAIHLNYWKWDSPFGVPTSHGCAGLRENDALFFWQFARIGTPVVVHY